jgi:hypothetical protein
MTREQRRVNDFLASLSNLKYATFADDNEVLI